MVLLESKTVQDYDLKTVRMFRSVRLLPIKFIKATVNGRVYLHKCFPQVRPLLNQLPMLFEESTQEQAEVLDEVLFIIFPV